MQIPLAPVRYLIGGRRHFRKLLPAGALVVFAVCIVLIIQFVSALRADMDLKEKELLGVEYIRHVRDVMEVVQQHRALSGIFLSGDTSAAPLITEKQGQAKLAVSALEAINVRAAPRLDTASRHAAARIQWQAISGGGLKLGAQDNFDQHSLLIEQLVMLVTHVAYTSGLAVDGDAEVYHLADTLADKLLYMIERLGQIRGLGTDILVRRTVSEAEIVRITAQQTLIDDVLPRISDNIGKVPLEHGGGEHVLREHVALQESVAHLSRDILAVRDLVRNHVLASGNPLAPQAFYARATRPIEAGFTLFDLIVPELERVLRSRSEQLAWSLKLGLLLALVVVLAGSYLFAGLYRYLAERESIQAQLRLAAQVFEHSREAIFITDKDKNIMSVNPAFTEVTGRAPGEVLGKNPRIWSSGMHDSGFYRQMHTALDNEGHWSGEIWNRRKDGEIYPEWVSISAIRNDKGEITNYLRISTDISGRKKDEERLQFLANYDVLTSLPNRAMFNQRLDYVLAHAGRYDEQFAVLFMDLDRFKIINDTLGHEAGDQLLKDVAVRLRGCLRESDTVARLGGDEFVMLITEFTHSRNVADVARKILETMARPFLLNGQECHVTASIGISSYPDDAQDVKMLLKNADIAMYQAKEHGKNNFQFYSAQMNVDSFDRLALEAALRRALERNEFLLHYQPKIDIVSGNITGMEALVRWQHPDKGMVPPAQFIPLAEETGLIVPIGEWVLRTACAQNREWQRQGFPSLRVAVNLSPRQFRQKNLVPEVAAILREAGLDAGLLELEITESMMVHDPVQTVKLLTELRATGIYLSIDDFGTGYSSLAHLKRFPIHSIKIDRSFIQDLPGDADSAAITLAIIAIADSLKLDVIAEGVENEAQMDFLRAHRCTEIQGYYFSKPLPPAEFAALLRESMRPVEKASPLRLISAGGVLP